MHLTFTGTPSCVPGFHLGIIDTMRSASLSKEDDMLFSILGCVTEPFSSITTPTVTLPCIPFLWHHLDISNYHR